MKTLIKVLHTSIYGTGVQMANPDAWAQPTLPVPMVVDHKFVETGSDVKDFHPSNIGGSRHRNCLSGVREKLSRPEFRISS